MYLFLFDNKKMSFTPISSNALEGQMYSSGQPVLYNSPKAAFVSAKAATLPESIGSTCANQADSEEMNKQSGYSDMEKALKALAMSAFLVAAVRQTFLRKDEGPLDIASLLQRCPEDSR